MIAVIGTQSTNELIKTVLGDYRKDYNISYYHYTDRTQIENIVQELIDVEGILFSGFVGLKTYETQKNRSNIPYGMITMDKLNLALGMLELVLEYKDIDVSRVYIDYLGMIKKYEKEFYDIIPETLTKRAQTFEFDDFSELTRENIFKDIQKKYNNGEIDVAIVSAAKISKELEELGILHKIDTTVIDEYVISSFNQLVNDIKLHNLNKQKKYFGIIQIKEKEQVNSLDTLLNKYKDNNEVLNLKTAHDKIYFEIISEDIYISHEKVYYKVLEDILNESTLEFSMGIGIGRSLVESEHNATKAIKYASSFGKRKCFLLTDEKDILGPINSEYCLLVNEYQLESYYEQSRHLGVKVFNLCRLFALYDIKKLLTTEDVMSYLNIAHRSSNRIMAILEEQGILEEGFEQNANKVGRPSKKYRLNI
ncbi:MAG: hypothetical protein JEZ08_11525 [Clostridiales bacterium]|nr:hypothetical protein [Clostridiales bacterium]